MAVPSAFKETLPRGDIVYPFHLLKDTFAAGESKKYELSHAYCLVSWTEEVTVFGDLRIKFGDTGDELPYGTKVFFRTSGFRNFAIRNTLGIPVTLHLVYTSDPNFLVNRSSI